MPKEGGDKPVEVVKPTRDPVPEDPVLPWPVAAVLQIPSQRAPLRRILEMLDLHTDNNE